MNPSPSNGSSLNEASAGDAAADGGPYADVIVAVPSRGLDRPWTYRVPAELSDRVRQGSVVRVPFHGRVLTGYVVAVHPAPDGVADPRSIKPIAEVRSPQEFWGEGLMQLAAWMQAFYGCLTLDALHAIIPEPVRAGLHRKVKGGGRSGVYELSDRVSVVDHLLDVLDGDAPQARRVVAALRERKRIPPSELLNEAHAGPEVLQRLREAGLLRYRIVPTDELTPADDPIRASAEEALGSTARPTLTDPQRAAVDRIVARVRAGKPAVVLLHGVTGSGKTEVYLHALETVMAEGRQGLVLVPEISLTPQAVHRYRSRLGDRVAVLHSALTPPERFEQWWRLRRGQLPLALGARSCVFAPFDRPALLIVDEEQDASYKQEQSPRYHARQIAIKRAVQAGGVVVLGSATPSLESYHWAREGRYELLELPDRVEGRPLPEIEVVDMRRMGRSGPRSIGAVLRDRLRETLARGEQAMLLMNRRGFSSYLMCGDCGHIERCPRCDISLTFHSAPPTLLCHYCLYERRPPSECPQCQGPDVRFFGSGTQRVEEELLRDFPGVGLARMDRDTTRHSGDHRRILERFGRGEVQILLGTQMIAKGHDFPGVTLVGVVLADTALNLPDFRAAERTFSLLVQVAGRAGRGERPGRVVIQTYNPEHPAVICAARQDYHAFFEAELEQRRDLSYPPFSHLVNVLFASEDEQAVEAAAKAAGVALAPAARAVGAGMLGPAPCAVTRIHRKYRWHLTFKAHQVQEIVPEIRKYLGNKAHSGVACSIDADPMSML